MEFIKPAMSVDEIVDSEADSEQAIDEPKMYKILLLNDDFTPMDFVTDVLQRFFGSTEENAVRLMLKVHNEGKAECGVFTFDVAETKYTQVIDYAREHNHPLRCQVEAE